MGRLRRHHEAGRPCAAKPARSGLRDKEDTWPALPSNSGGSVYFASNHLPSSTLTITRARSSKPL